MSRADEAYSAAAAQLYTKQLRANQRGQTADDPYNVVLYLTGEDALRNLIALDEFSHRIVKRRAPPWRSPGDDWTESDMNLLRVYLTQHFGCLFSVQNIEHAVLEVANRAAFHPVRDYLESLTWDGTERVPYWLGVYLDATRAVPDVTREYIYAVSRMWMIAAVARVYEPGCKFDNVLILEGEQGAGKSTALAILGGEWFTDTPFRIGEKDGYQALQGRWIIELPELENFSGVDSSRAKAFFSSREDNFRPPYGRRNQEFPRQCAFAGTTNQLEYLKDATGNRRYWPVRVNRLDRDALTRDRDQLWAEAAHRYHAGEPFHLPPDDPAWAVFNDEQAMREVADPWEIAIRNWRASPDGFLKDQFTLHDALHYGLGVDTNRMDQRAMATRVGKILHRLGYAKIRGSTREDRARGVFYYRKRDTPTPKGN